MTVNDLPFMPEFFDRYIKLVDANTEVIVALENTKDDLASKENLLKAYQNFRYQPGKWTPKDIIQHLIDNERIQSYRALAFARNDKNSLPGYDENLYADNTLANDRTLTDLLQEFSAVRNSTIQLFRSFSDKQLVKEGNCSNIKVTVLSLGFQIIGHAIHHLNILEARYFTN